MFRLILYVLAGITSALLGWNLGQGAMYVLQLFERLPVLDLLGQLRQWKEVILFPFITVCLSVGMVLNEIFICNPTRPKLNLRIALRPLLYAIGIGFLVGLTIGGLLQIVYLPKFGLDERSARVIGWWLIGATVGLVEGLTWQFYSMEAGDKSRRQKRLFFSILAASVAGLIAASIFERVRTSWDSTPEWFQLIEDPLGFSILGILLGIAFTIATSPSYMAAIRAGKGFEYRGKTVQALDPEFNNNSALAPVISTLNVKDLKFVSEERETKIDEGLSIQLPEKTLIKIGGTQKETMSNGEICGSDIYLPSLPPHIADIIVDKRDTKLEPNPKNYAKIYINGKRLENFNPITLKHNTLIAFYTDEKDEDNPNEPKIYRFVYYNRFLDPEG